MLPSRLYLRCPLARPRVRRPRCLGKWSFVPRDPGRRPFPTAFGRFDDFRPRLLSAPPRAEPFGWLRGEVRSVAPPRSFLGPTAPLWPSGWSLELPPPLRRGLAPRGPHRPLRRRGPRAPLSPLGVRGPGSPLAPFRPRTAIRSPSRARSDWPSRALEASPPRGLLRRWPPRPACPCLLSPSGSLRSGEGCARTPTRPLSASCDLMAAKTSVAATRTPRAPSMAGPPGNPAIVLDKPHRWSSSAGVGEKSFRMFPLEDREGSG